MDKLKEFGTIKTTPEQKAKIKQMAQELADNLNGNVKKGPNLSDLCKCGHTYGSHPFLKRRTEGFPMPPAYSCIDCKCKKFELDKNSE
ncbi:MAG: hypothetical protein A2931_04135 [Candidatus Niyogibacteria bacterium RIFCSPLOWO2_01_FULL_45_48]|uniref:Uncharacterized protein n=2 Tax=Candidatus Niyogiibacteriota TaxID=1817912 RepID=A0A1G2EZ37_9BACT|nr:MAG: hypothetical protein A2931_04135 [Candidatus Niyogibacteria bacterium RIFCSPLOWO2_01_FULL_45_48]OGZ30518.1 MAG: hypothetical protein A3J00_03505 [Candidatus Niyogibacteria bacterium RIFCSPLOWO2_02_FULL_45_13]